jgi:hypothetical protein
VQFKPSFKFVVVVIVVVVVKLVRLVQKSVGSAQRISLLCKNSVENSSACISISRVLLGMNTRTNEGRPLLLST